MWNDKLFVGIVVDASKHKELREFVYCLYLNKKAISRHRIANKNNLYVEKCSKFNYIRTPYKNLVFEIYVKRLYVGTEVERNNVPLKDFKSFVIKELKDLGFTGFKKKDMILYTSRLF